MNNVLSESIEEIFADINSFCRATYVGDKNKKRISQRP